MAHRVMRHDERGEAIRAAGNKPSGSKGKQVTNYFILEAAFLGFPGGHVPCFHLHKLPMQSTRRAT